MPANEKVAVASLLKNCQQRKGCCFFLLKKQAHEQREGCCIALEKTSVLTKRRLLLHCS